MGLSAGILIGQGHRVVSLTIDWWQRCSLTHIAEEDKVRGRAVSIKLIVEDLEPSMRGSKCD